MQYFCLFYRNSIAKSTQLDDKIVAKKQLVEQKYLKKINNSKANIQPQYQMKRNSFEESSLPKIMPPQINLRSSQSTIDVSMSDLASEPIKKHKSSKWYKRLHPSEILKSFSGSKEKKVKNKKLKHAVMEVWYYVFNCWTKLTSAFVILKNIIPKFRFVLCLQMLTFQIN